MLFVNDGTGVVGGEFREAAFSFSIRSAIIGDIVVVGGVSGRG